MIPASGGQANQQLGREGRDAERRGEPCAPCARPRRGGDGRLRPGGHRETGRRGENRGLSPGAFKHLQEHRGKGTAPQAFPVRAGSEHPANPVHPPAGTAGRARSRSSAPRPWRGVSCLRFPFYFPISLSPIFFSHKDDGKRRERARMVGEGAGRRGCWGSGTGFAQAPVPALPGWTVRAGAPPRGDRENPGTLPSSAGW